MRQRDRDFDWNAQWQRVQLIVYQLADEVEIDRFTKSKSRGLRRLDIETERKGRERKSRTMLEGEVKTGLRKRPTTQFDLE
jgi:hypothetical protein